MWHGVDAPAVEWGVGEQSMGRILNGSVNCGNWGYLKETKEGRG